jgi:hypothetical protein
VIGICSEREAICPVFLPPRLLWRISEMRRSESFLETIILGFSRLEFALSALASSSPDASITMSWTR